jgi:predicted phosphodiesterase
MEKRYFESMREEPFFRYAIITDTHLRPEQGDESSPWEVNKHANDRARWVINKIFQAKPDFIIHMGDILHPLPHLTPYSSAAEAALRMFNEIEIPTYFIPGNHDVGDKNNPTMPAYVVDDHGLDLYMKWFGPLYQSFNHKGIHFILINAQVLNSGLTRETEQSRWLEADLEANDRSRIHVFSHYPPYVLEPSEPSNYDNIDEPARSWLLRLLEQYEVEAFFAGHVHHFIYQKHGVTDIYNLLATSFVRQDYSEMFRIEAAEEYGRNDIEKLGWCIVDVYKNTHITRIFRSQDSTLREGETTRSEALKVRTCHTKESVIAPIGVHLRHPWAEIIDLPYNGPIDEFIRKRVRNDYTLLALWECGIRMLRVPLNDLVDERIRARMKALTDIGHRFNVFSFGIPCGVDLKALKLHHDLVNTFEIVLPWKDVEKVIPDLLKLRVEVPVPFYLAKVKSSANQKHGTSKFSHYVSYGFSPRNTEDIEEFLRLKGASDATDGFVFGISAEDSPWDAIRSISKYAEKKGFNVVANVRLASENPAEYLTDDIWVANRVAEAIVASAASPNVDVFLDTFIDLDRGYFPRVGLYDRRYNRRLGSHVLAHLQGVLNEFCSNITLGKRWEDTDGITCVFESTCAVFNLFLNHSSKTRGIRIAHPGNIEPGRKGKAKLVDLSSGFIYEVTWKRIDQGLVLSNQGPCEAPSLLILEK